MWARLTTQTNVLANIEHSHMYVTSVITMKQSCIELWQKSTYWKEIILFCWYIGNRHFDFQSDFLSEIIRIFLNRNHWTVWSYAPFFCNLHFLTIAIFKTQCVDFWPKIYESNFVSNYWKLDNTYCHIEKWISLHI